MIHTLLAHPNGSLTKYKIAKLSECTPSWALIYLKQLEEQKLIHGTTVLDANKLVDLYLTLEKKFHYVTFEVKDPATFLKSVKLPYALTTYSADHLLFGHLYIQRYDCYINPDDKDSWRDKIVEAGGLLGGNNLRLIPLPIISTQEKYDLVCVDNARLLIDLKREKGVCLDAYQMLLRRWNHE